MDGSFNAAIPFILIGLVLLVLGVWLLMRLGQSTTVVRDDSRPGDVLDEGAEPAKRNQALIDTAPAAATTQPAPEPTPEPTPAPVPTAPSEPPRAALDDLSQLKGVGPKLVKLLNSEGVTSFAQIAKMTKADIDALEEKIGAAGKFESNDWVAQAKALAKG